MLHFARTKLYKAAPHVSTSQGLILPRVSQHTHTTSHPRMGARGCVPCARVRLARSDRTVRRGAAHLSLPKAYAFRKRHRFRKRSRCACGHPRPRSSPSAMAARHDAGAGPRDAAIGVWVCEVRCPGGWGRNYCFGELRYQFTENGFIVVQRKRKE